MTTKFRIAGLAAGAALMLVMGALLGGGLTAQAQSPSVGTTKACPISPPEAWEACVEEYRASFDPAPVSGSTDGEDGLTEGSAEAVTCSLETGCTVNVVDGDGKTVKVMHITFSDPEDAETAEITSE